MIFTIWVQKHFLGHLHHNVVYWIPLLHLCWRFYLRATHTRPLSIHHFCQNRCSEILRSIELTLSFETHPDTSTSRSLPFSDRNVVQVFRPHEPRRLLVLVCRFEWLLSLDILNWEAHWMLKSHGYLYLKFVGLALAEERMSKLVNVLFAWALSSFRVFCLFQRLFVVLQNR